MKERRNGEGTGGDSEVEGDGRKEGETEDHKLEGKVKQIGETV